MGVGNGAPGMDQGAILPACGLLPRVHLEVEGPLLVGSGGHSSTCLTTCLGVGFLTLFLVFFFLDLGSACQLLHWRTLYLGRPWSKTKQLGSLQRDGCALGQLVFSQATPFHIEAQIGW